eukprot:scaffold2548_cov147-Skeletonema_menzelii.AAC.1
MAAALSRQELVGSFFAACSACSRLAAPFPKKKREGRRSVTIAVLLGSATSASRQPARANQLESSLSSGNKHNTYVCISQLF